jgi:hypothetical protein
MVVSVSIVVAVVDYAVASVVVDRKTTQRCHHCFLDSHKMGLERENLIHNTELTYQVKSLFREGSVFKGGK